MTKDCNSCNHHLQGRTLNDCPSICWGCFDHSREPLVLRNWVPKSGDLPSVKTVLGDDSPRFGEAPANAKQVAGDHYKNMGVEPWDVVDTWPLEQRIGAYRHGALKYLMRMGSKDQSLQEIEKGIHYLEKLAEVLHGAK